MRPKPTPRCTSADGWLRTGDLGVVHERELYITGRHKEILFVNGQNYYPHDLEAVALEVPGIELGKIVVSGVRASGAESDELVVFVLHRGELADFLPLGATVARRIGEHAGLEVDAVVPVRRIPKTTSGKVQRHLLEEEYLAGANDADLATLRDAGGCQQGAPLDGASTSRRNSRRSATVCWRGAHRTERQPVRRRREFAQAGRHAGANRAALAGAGRRHRHLRSSEHCRTGAADRVAPATAAAKAVSETSTPNAAGAARALLAVRRGAARARRTAGGARAEDPGRGLRDPVRDAARTEQQHRGLEGLAVRWRKRHLRSATGERGSSTRRPTSCPARLPTATESRALGIEAEIAFRLGATCRRFAPARAMSATRSARRSSARTR